MEDRYLFKAKKTDSEEWVVGSLISMPHGGYMIDRVADSRRFRVMINPSTICQCTGLKDKNGKLIWENDIVKVKYSDGFEEITEVKYSKNGYSPYLNEYECEGCCCRCEVAEIEIIGNIFDNKELLESEE